MKKYYLLNRKEGLLENILIFFFLPPFFSVLYFLYNVIQKRNIILISFYFAAVVLTSCYVAIAYDDVLRYLNMQTIEEDTLIINHFLNYLASLWVKNGAQFMNIIMIYRLFLCFMIIYVFHKCTNLKKFFCLVCLLVVLYERSMTDLVYNILSFVWIIFVAVLMKERTLILSFPLMAMGCIIFHPAAFFLLIPAFFLMLTSRQSFSICSFITLILLMGGVYAVFRIVDLRLLYLLGDDVVDQFAEKFDYYNDASEKFGSSQISSYGIILRYLKYYHYYILAGIGAYISIKFYKLFQVKMIPCINLISALLMFVTINSGTFFERFSIANSISFFLLMAILANKRGIGFNTKQLAISYFITTFILLSWLEGRWTYQVYPHKKDICYRVFYYPGALLIDVGDYGFSNQDLKSYRWE